MSFPVRKTLVFHFSGLGNHQRFLEWGLRFPSQTTRFPPFWFQVRRSTPGLKSPGSIWRCYVRVPKMMQNMSGTIFANHAGVLLLLQCYSMGFTFLCCAPASPTITQHCPISRRGANQFAKRSRQVARVARLHVGKLHDLLDLALCHFGSDEEHVEKACWDGKCIRCSGLQKLFPLGVCDVLCPKPPTPAVSAQSAVAAAKAAAESSAAAADALTRATVASSRASTIVGRRGESRGGGSKEGRRDSHRSTSRPRCICKP